jgi:Ca2+-binding RTX toxin-like protein
MALSASVNNGIVYLTGTQAGWVEVRYNSTGQAEVYQRGTLVVAASPSDGPAYTVDTTGLVAAELRITGNDLNEAFRIRPITGSYNWIFGEGGLNSLEIIDDGNASPNELWISDITTLTGSAGQDSVLLAKSATNLRITGGVETIVGGSGSDSAILSSGNDVLSMAGIETLDGGAGIDTITLGGNGGTYTFRNVEVVRSLFDNAEKLTLETGPADVHMGNGNDTVVGSTGRDTLNGGAGTDLLTGGGGLDQFTGSANELNGDTLTDFSFGETITVTNGVAGAMTAVLVGTHLFIDPDGAGSSAMFEMTISSAPVGRLAVIGNSLTLYASSPPPSVSISTVAPLVAGEAGTVMFNFSAPVQGFELTDAWTVNGSLMNLVQVNSQTYSATLVPSAEGLVGITVAAGSYQDLTAYAGTSASFTAAVKAAPPVLVQAGSTGVDNLRGTIWGDNLSGLAGDDGIAGGDGDDLLYGGHGSDAITGDLGADVIWGEAGGDLLDGGWGNDQIWGGSENDTLYGSLGNDLVKGETGNDLVKGNDGNDTLWGGAGNDRLTGGDGRDTFVFDLKPSKSSNRDTISDFDAAADTIWLNDQVFTKLGKGTEGRPVKIKKGFFVTGDKAKDKDDYLIYSKTKGTLSYDADGAGSKHKTVEIVVLKNGLALSYSDFFMV